MRASNPGGRFTTTYEIDSYWAGIDEDLQRPVGGELPWSRFDPDASKVDGVYDVGANDGGRAFMAPRMLKYLVAQVFQGQTTQNDRGFYNADILRVTVNMADFLRTFPNIVPEVDNFLRDRAVFNDTVFRPTRFYLRGRVLDRYTIVTIDLTQVHDEELVNDVGFQWGASE